MSFSSLLEEANHTLESNDLNDTQWSIDSNSSNTLPSPLPPSSKSDPKPYLNQNCVKQNFINGTGGLPNVNNQNCHNFSTQVNISKQLSRHHVIAEPNPFYHQNGYPNSFTEQLHQETLIQHRTHLPIQLDEFYNSNALLRHQLVPQNLNNNHAMSQNNYLKQLSYPPYPVTEKSRKRPNKKATPRKKVKIELKGPPPNWKQLYDNIMEMRNNIVAPVDVMGCFKNAQTDKGPKIYRYQVMISLMLSSQTKDEVTAGAMRRLKQFGLDPKHISQTEESVLAQLIHPVGFWQKKAGYIKNASRIVHTEYDDEIPKTVEGLTSLPGIGPKMAHLCMEFAWDKLTGISVDTHVHRICQRLGWTPTGIKNPDDTRKLLEHWLPREEWGRINLMMVGFGQVICLPTKPRCFECRNKDLCPYASQNPDRTVKKSNQSVRPSARDMKEPKTEQPGMGSLVKLEMKEDSARANSHGISHVPPPPPAATCGYNTPLLTPPLHPTADYSPSPVQCKTEPRPSYQHLAPYFPQDGAPTSALRPPRSQPAPQYSQQFMTPSYHNIKHEMLKSPEQVYQTLTPSASPHDAAPHAPPLTHQYPPGGYYGNSSGQFTQSSVIDTAASCSNPLINPLIKEEPITRLSHAGTSDNVLDSFLDW